MLVVRQEKIGPTAITTLSKVSEELRARTGINIFTAPFKSKKNAQIVDFIKTFFDTERPFNQRRAENLLQAVIRNPILRGDYGHNSVRTARIKGFNRFMIDTGQLFKALKAKAAVRRVS